MESNLSRINFYSPKIAISTDKNQISETTNVQSYTSSNTSLPLQALKANFTPFMGKTELEKNLALAEEACDYVKSMNLVSTTKWEMENPVIAGSGDEDFRAACHNRMRMDKERDNKPIDEVIAITNRMAYLLEVGNCAENAIIAATYLHDEKNIDNFALVTAIQVDDIDKFEKNPIDKGYNNPNHVFVVLGLDHNANLEDPNTWGKNAVIVDPWGEIKAPVVDQKNPTNSGIYRINKLFNNPENLVFKNYAMYIDPTKDKKSPYNWENYQREQKLKEHIELAKRELCITREDISPTKPKSKSDLNIPPSSSSTTKFMRL